MPKRKSSSILIGRLFDETGEAMTANHAVKQDKRYRYYISRCLNGKQPDSHTGWRIPADEIETITADALKSFLSDPIHLMEAFRSVSISDEDAVRLSTSITRQSPSQHTLKQFLQKAVQRIDIARDNIRIAVNLLEITRHFDLDAPSTEEDSAPPIYQFTIATKLRRRGVETKIILGDTKQRMPCVDHQLVELVAKAYYWFDLLKRGQVQSIAEIATSENICSGDVSRFLPLAFLSPVITTAILEGRQPVELTPEKLKRMPPLPFSWEEQRRMLGFDFQGHRV